MASTKASARRARRRGPKAGVSQGAAVGAPDEYGFVSGESPAPPGVAAASRRGGGVQQPGRPARAGSLFRSLWMITKVCAGVAVVIGAALALAWGARRFAMTTPRFAVTQIEVRGNARLSDERLAKSVGVERGMNVFAIDPAAVERSLLEDPWIREAKVVRKLPGTIELEVAEYQAHALAVIGGELFAVTRSGVPFLQLEAGEMLDLPVITGLSLEELSADRALAVERLEVAAEVLRYYERSSLARVHPAQELHLLAGGRVVLTIGSAGVALHLGSGPWSRKIAMAERALQRVRTAGQLPGIVFVDNEAHPERVVVRMR